MEVLTEEESRQVMEGMTNPFTRQVHGNGSLLHTEQDVLLIHGPGEDYKLTRNQSIPKQKTDQEILVKVLAIGLNPVDWKGPDYNFGLPSLPWINGRDLVGVVVKAHSSLRRIRVGDVILSPSTDYRDIRKAAFQEYVISTEQNSARVPDGFDVQASAAVGVAFVTAALALGICCGVDFTASKHAPSGPNLFHLVREMDPEAFPQDIRDEVLAGICESERAKPGDWLAIWGASSATGLIALQLAKLAGLRTICIVDVARYGEMLLAAGADLLVDRLDTVRVVEIVHGVTNGKLRFALDTVGRDTATTCQRALCRTGARSHLVGLAGLPKETVENIVHHNVPVKAFHCVGKVGESLMVWLETLLLRDGLITPPIELAVGGLSGINKALDRLKTGSSGGKRLVVPL